MAYNLFIAYDLMHPGQDYDAVRDAIKSLGPWWQFQFSLFWVNTELTPEQAYAHVWAAMDVNDGLCVVNAFGGVVSNWDQPPIESINAIWHSP